jgi:hypothetical protein
MANLSRTIGRFNSKINLEIMKSKPEKPKSKTQESEAEEWDLSQGMGILPDGIPLTQNIGCVGSKKEIKTPLKHGN